MAEWLYEAGIGENRAALVSRGTIWKARIELEGIAVRFGTVTNARLVDKHTGKVALDRLYGPRRAPQRKRKTLVLGGDWATA